MTKDISTEKRIKEAAKKIFTKKGLAGARMQDIADEAQINKAMLHYYFRSKQRLFEMIFEEQLSKLFSALSLILLSDLSFEEKIREFVKREMEIISEFPAMPLFVLHEVAQNPGILQKKLSDKPIHLIRIEFKKIIEAEVAAGRMKPVRFEQFIMDLISLCLYPVIARPVFQYILGKNDAEYEALMELRKSGIAELMLNQWKA